MSDKPSHTQGRNETRAALASERAELAERVWGEVEVQKVAADQNTARLKALRLERDAAVAAVKKSESDAKP
ncbi:hypothetical protein [Methylobacterium sp. E-045]|uniref:hypothetical protein n=1 Tax=Methylobacterium sp. E-045 TaxID=2836575 RepID=UPI001FBAABBB|nr:hypothetical protein [Methylobacterium sp. E-045]MCJ2131441.1 hypothetical protein [Methylobacterium sp. E-045]